MKQQPRRLRIVPGGDVWRHSRGDHRQQAFAQAQERRSGCGLEALDHIGRLGCEFVSRQGSTGQIVLIERRFIRLFSFLYD